MLPKTLNCILAKVFHCHQVQTDFPFVNAGNHRDKQVLSDHQPVAMDWGSPNSHLVETCFEG